MVNCNNFVDQELMGLRVLQLLLLLETGNFSDLILETKDGHKLKVHKSILVAVSDYFSEQLNAVGAQGIETLKVDFEKAPLELILKFIYAGAVEFPNNLSKEIYIGAQLFGLRTLQTYCGEILENDVNEQNCLELFKFSVPNLADNLRDKCVRIFCESDENLRKNFIDQLTVEEMIVFISIESHLKSIPSQEDLLKNLINWVKQNFELRKLLLLKITKLIEFDLVSKQYITKSLLTDRQLTREKDFMAKMMSLMFDRIEHHSLTQTENNATDTSAHNSLPESVATLADQNLIESDDLWENSIIPGTSNNATCSTTDDTLIFVLNPETANEQNIETTIHTITTSAENLKADKMVFLVEKSQTNAENNVATQNQTNSSNVAKPTTQLKNNGAIPRNKTAVMAPVQCRPESYMSYKSDSKIHFGKLSSDGKEWLFPSKNGFEYTINLFSTHFYKNQFFISGGHDMCRVQNFSSYDPKENQFVELCSMKKARASHQTASVGGKLYACGGLQEASKSTEYYDFERNEWFMSASFNEGRQDFGLACLGKFWQPKDNCLYAIGGQYARNVEMLDIRKKDWNIVAQMPDTHPKICKSLVCDEYIFCLNKEGQGYVFDARNKKFIEDVPRAFSNQQKHHPFDFFANNSNIYGLFYDEKNIFKAFICNKDYTKWESLSYTSAFNPLGKLNSFNMFISEN